MSITRQKRDKPAFDNALRAIAFTALCCTAAVSAQPTVGESSRDLLTIDHYVRHQSTVPAIAGETVQLYVRERVAAGALARTAEFEDRVVLFVHGAGTPAEVAFDVPYEGYSWMAHLASAGFDVFSMDMTGYGRSTRPAPMNDPCNLSEEQQQALIPGTLDAPCEPSRPGALTTIASDWDDIDAVVEYLRALRGVERVSLVGWSLGGPRAGGYAARHPQKVSRIVLLAPAYSADMPAEPVSAAAREPSAGADAQRSGQSQPGSGAQSPTDGAQRSAPGLPVAPQGAGAAMTTQSRTDFDANWARQVACTDQYDPRAAESVWAEMLASDPVGATWGPGVRRAPRTAVWGWGRDVVSRIQTPMLLIAAAHDAQVTPDRVELLYQHLGAAEKVLIDLGCASHNAMWEGAHRLLFDASLEWLEHGTVNGMADGTLQLGYE